MNCAIDRGKLIMYMRNSIGIPAEAGFVPAGLPLRNAEMVHGYTYESGEGQKPAEGCRI